MKAEARRACLFTLPPSLNRKAGFDCFQQLAQTNKPGLRSSWSSPQHQDLLPSDISQSRLLTLELNSSFGGFALSFSIEVGFWNKREFDSDILFIRQLWGVLVKKQEYVTLNSNPLRIICLFASSRKVRQITGSVGASVSPSVNHRMGWRRPPGIHSMAHPSVSLNLSYLLLKISNR